MYMSGPQKDTAEVNGGRWGGGGNVVRGIGNKDRGTHKVLAPIHAHFITL